MSNVWQVDVSLGRVCLPCGRCTPGLAWRHARCIQHSQCLFAVLYKFLHKTQKNVTKRIIMRHLLQHIAQFIPCNFTYTNMKSAVHLCRYKCILKKGNRNLLHHMCLTVRCPGPLHKTFRYNFLKTALFSVHRMLFC
jgi:hypothetical protein